MDEIVREFLVESYENLDELDQDLVALEGTPGSRELLGRVFRTIHTIKGTCGFLGFGRLEGLSHAGESLLSELRDGLRAMDQPTTDVLLRMVDKIREILASVEESGMEGEIAVDVVIEAIGVVLQKPMNQIAPRSVIPTASPETSADDPAPVTTSDSSIRVEVDVLNTLMRQVGELVLVRNQITRLAAEQLDADFVKASQRLSLIASELQEGVMKARMQPIGHLWAIMPRIVRTLAATCGRQVRLEVSGGETELDRALLEAVKDPLMHLVRNAVDHGIEAVETRVAANKPDAGLLILRAFHSGGQVVVEVVDDGKGIDVGQVAARALEGGLRTRDQIAAMSPPDLLKLLFLPGFSMAQAVTNISGRGVGMDVVHTQIGAIGGSVEVDSTVGRGTTWRLRIPLTLAIIPALIVESRGELYAIPEVNVRKLVALGREKVDATIEYVGGAPVFRMGGALLPLVELPEVLGLPGVLGSGHEHEHGADTVIAVLHADTRRFGLVINRVLDTEEIVVKPLTARLQGVGVYAGATLLGDGRVALILDVPAIARRSLTERAVEAHPELTSMPTRPLTANRQVLVVSIAGGRRFAIPLAAVTRIERLRRDDVEHVGGREVVQYRSAIVPLIRLDRLLGGSMDRPDADPRQPELLVVVSTRGTHTVAIGIRQILDIVEDDVARHSPIGDLALVGSTVLGERVTELLDVRHVVLSGDPSFFDDDDADDDPWASDVGHFQLGAVGA